MALACDLIVAARDAKLGIPEVGVGLIAAAGALLRLPRRIPFNLAMEMAVTGDPLGAEVAHDKGLINRVVEPGETLGAALEIGRRIAANAPLAVAATKEILASARDWTAAGTKRDRGLRSLPASRVACAREARWRCLRDPLPRLAFAGLRDPSRSPGEPS